MRFATEIATGSPPNSFGGSDVLRGKDVGHFGVHAACRQRSRPLASRRHACGHRLGRLSPLRGRDRRLVGFHHRRPEQLRERNGVLSS